MRLQPGEQDDHVVAEILPHREQDDRRHRRVGIAEPVDRIEADRAEAVVDHAVAGVEQIAPDDRDGDERRHDRREQRGAEESRLSLPMPPLSSIAAPSDRPIDSGTPAITK